MKTKWRFSLLSDSFQDLVTSSLSELEDLWKNVEAQFQERQTWIQDLDDRLCVLEGDRMEQVPADLLTGHVVLLLCLFIFFCMFLKDS